MFRQELPKLGLKPRRKIHRRNKVETNSRKKTSTLQTTINLQVQESQLMMSFRNVTTNKTCQCRRWTSRRLKLQARSRLSSNPSRTIWRYSSATALVRILKRPKKTWFSKSQTFCNPRGTSIRTYQVARVNLFTWKTQTSVAWAHLPARGLLAALPSTTLNAQLLRRDTFQTQ